MSRKVSVLSGPTSTVLVTAEARAVNWSTAMTIRSAPDLRCTCILLTLLYLCSSKRAPAAAGVPAHTACGVGEVRAGDDIARPEFLRAAVGRSVPASPDWRVALARIRRGNAAPVRRLRVGREYHLPFRRCEIGPCRRVPSATARRITRPRGREGPARQPACASCGNMAPGVTSAPVHRGPVEDDRPPRRASRWLPGA